MSENGEATRKRSLEREEELYRRGDVRARYMDWLSEMNQGSLELERRDTNNLTLGYVTTDVRSPDTYSSPSHCHYSRVRVLATISFTRRSHSTLHPTSLDPFRRKSRTIHLSTLSLSTTWRIRWWRLWILCNRIRNIRPATWGHIVRFRQTKSWVYTRSLLGTRNAVV